MLCYTYQSTAARRDIFGSTTCQFFPLHHASCVLSRVTDFVLPLPQPYNALVQHLLLLLRSRGHWLLRPPGDELYTDRLQPALESGEPRFNVCRYVDAVVVGVESQHANLAHVNLAVGCMLYVFKT